ncbi:MAG: hypothetical protein CL862_13180 [Cyanobium sp. NAT70]|nr:hypothetical protein [Cyanobium sp. NAT70]
MQSGRNGLRSGRPSRFQREPLRRPRRVRVKRGVAGVLLSGQRVPVVDPDLEHRRARPEHQRHDGPSVGEPAPFRAGYAWAVFERGLRGRGRARRRLEIVHAIRLGRARSLDEANAALPNGGRHRMPGDPHSGLPAWLRLHGLWPERVRRIRRDVPSRIHHPPAAVRPAPCAA